MLLKGFSSISKEQQMLACGIQMKQHLISKDTRIQTSLGANWTEKVQVAHAIYLEQV